MCICSCVWVSRSRELCHLKVYDVYSPIWGCVLLPLCSSQESPQQEDWCQGKLAALFSYLTASFPLYNPFSARCSDALHAQNYFYYSINISSKGVRDDLTLSSAAAFTLIFFQDSLFSLKGTADFVCHLLPYQFCHSFMLLREASLPSFFKCIQLLFSQEPSHWDWKSSFFIYLMTFSKYDTTEYLIVPRKCSFLKQSW